jgi:acetoin utilization protein AcuB
VFVADWMTRKLVTVSPETPLGEAVRLMRESGYRRLPVVKGEKLVGLLTESDLLQSATAETPHVVDWEARDLEQDTPVSRVMSPEPLIGAPTMLLEEAGGLMAEHGVSSLPIVEAGRLVGIITLSDILRAYGALLRGKRGAVMVILGLPKVQKLDEILPVLAEHDVRLLSFVTDAGHRHRGRRLIRIAVEGRDAEAAIEALEEAGFPIVRQIES